MYYFFLYACFSKSLSKLHANFLTAFVVFTFLLYYFYFLSRCCCVYFIFFALIYEWLPLLLVLGFLLLFLCFSFFTAFTHTYTYIYLYTYYHTPAAARCDDAKYLSIIWYFSMQFIQLISLSVFFIIYFNFFVVLGLLFFFSFCFFFLRLFFFCLFVCEDLGFFFFLLKLQLWLSSTYWLCLNHSTHCSSIYVTRCWRFWRLLIFLLRKFQTIHKNYNTCTWNNSNRLWNKYEKTKSISYKIPNVFYGVAVYCSLVVSIFNVSKNINKPLDKKKNNKQKNYFGMSWVYK